MSRILTAIFLSIALHVLILMNLSFYPVAAPNPETMLVRLVQTAPQLVMAEPVFDPTVKEITPGLRVPLNSPQESENDTSELPAVNDFPVEMGNQPSEMTGSGESVSGDAGSAGETSSDPGENDGQFDDNNPAVETNIPGPDLDSIRSQYSALVLGEISRHKQYPPTAQRLGQEGNVGLRFTVDSSGTVSGLIIDASSGFSSLDNAALEAVRSASPLTPPPSELGNGHLTLTITIVFSLN